MEGLPPSLIAGLRVAAQGRLVAYGAPQEQQQQQQQPSTDAAQAAPADSSITSEQPPAQPSTDAVPAAAPQSPEIVPTESEVQQAMSEAMGGGTIAVQQPLGQPEWSYGSSWTGPANWGSLGCVPLLRNMFMY